ncbi:hypothetical protein SUGI_0475260 [Cryptomeria japonica]|uniref:GDSL esterase/lipase At4g10955 n=1 Tax=Cryptomeria japonica TaxID=3369 RepID=UPI002408B4A4|nr:GDSL esterase/lipase At4g10955 [Cryptomeria japonica]GLJ24845.1 hypothetical protein SUGI_0475260 [Cryptomeria japonica]
MSGHDANIINEIPDLANPDWRDPKDRRRIAACLLNVVYQLERGNEMVNEWCNLLKFEVAEKITETIQGNERIFGAVFKWVGESRRVGEVEELQFPSEVVAFRGTISEGIYVLRKDIENIWKAINARHASMSGVDIGLHYLQRSIERQRPHNIWIAGHSLGAAIAVAAVRKMKREDRDKIEAHLFNLPFLSPRLPEVKFFEMVGRALAAVRDSWRSLALCAPNALDYKMIDDEILRGLYNDFIGVRDWIPNIYVGNSDPISCSYIPYFEKMQGIYEQRSRSLYERMKYLFCFEVAQERTPCHLLPSARLFVKDTNNHHLGQWWSRSLKLEGKIFVPPEEAQLY